MAHRDAWNRRPPSVDERQQAIEEAAKICDEMYDEADKKALGYAITREAAKRIRALSSAPKAG